MSNIKKFLDLIGVTHLWNKVEENFPNNEELAIIVNAIDETKADKADLVGKKVSNGEIFNNYNKNVATGLYSHAEGSMSKAEGDYSHVEGYEVSAYGNSSHAEGSGDSLNITISGEANAKTYTLNSGGLRLNLMLGRVVYYNGIYAKVISTYSDGNGLLQFTLDKSLSREALSSVTAQLLFGVSYSYYSHVENKDNVASGTCSHAEGNRTVAAGMNLHVQGKFNLVDLEDKYAHIVGNGANWTNPSNAHTLDWEGNAWFAGDIKIGGTNYDEAAAEVLTSLDLPNENDALELLYEMGIIELIIDENGLILTDENGNILISK